MVSFCNPGVLGSPSQFRRHYELPILAGREPGASEEEVGGWCVSTCVLGEGKGARAAYLTSQLRPCQLSCPSIHSLCMPHAYVCSCPCCAAQVRLGAERSAELSAIVNEFILRRTNSLLSAHLPPKVPAGLVVLCAALWHTHARGHKELALIPFSCTQPHATHCCALHILALHKCTHAITRHACTCARMHSPQGQPHRLLPTTTHGARPSPCR